MSTPVPKDPWPDLPIPCDELLEVRRRRYREARKARLTIAESELFADSDTDIGILRKLHKAGCDPALIASIVL